MNTVIRPRFFALSFVIALSVAGGFPDVRAQQPTPVTGTSDREPVDPKVLEFVQPIEAAAGDDELAQKLKERHNVAVKLLESRIDEYRRNAGGLVLVLEAARLVGEAKLDLAADRDAQLAVYESALELARMIEQHFQTTYDAGVAAAADLARAKYARLSVEVQILKLKRQP